jgi:hypothetical protein
MITPILTYGSEIWIADHKINIEHLHNTDKLSDDGRLAFKPNNAFIAF